MGFLDLARINYLARWIRLANSNHDKITGRTKPRCLSIRIWDGYAHPIPTSALPTLCLL